jgi:hypothetical protein
MARERGITGRRERRATVAVAQTVGTIRIGRRARNRILAVGRMRETGTWAANVRRLAADSMVAVHASVRMMRIDLVVQAGGR